MAKESVLQIRIDTALKDAAESLYRDMGTTFSEAVRIFARQSVLSRGMSFSLRASAPEGRSAGAFADYANPALRGREAGAFARAMEAKHARPA